MLRAMFAGPARAVGRIVRRRGPSRLLGIGTAAMVVLGAVGFALGHAVPQLGVNAGSADAWLPTTSRGSVSLVDGATGTAGLELTLPGTRGHPLIVSQQGETVLVQDPSTGVIMRIDTRELTVGPAVTAGQGTSVFTGANAAYLVDYPTGTVTRIDPATLRPVSPAFQVTGVLGQRAAVAADGTLWLPVLSDGTVVPITASGLGTPVRVADGGSHSLVVTDADGQPVAVDQTTGTISALGGAHPAVISLPGSAAAPGTTLLVPASSGSALLPMLATNGTPSLVLADLAAGSTRTVALAPGVSGHQLGSPQIAGARVYVPDYTTGTAHVYDTGRDAWLGDIAVTGRAGNFQAEVVNDNVYFNDPAVNDAVAVGPDGQVHRVAKTGPDVPADTGQPTSTSPLSATTPSNTGNQTVPPVIAAQDSRPHRTSTAPPPVQQTQPAAPLAPDGVTATAGAGYVDVSWRPPSSGGAVSGYRVLVSPAAGSQAALSATAVRISGLTCATDYGFTVESVGAQGETVPAPPVHAHPCLAPAAPAGLTATVQAGYTRVVNLSWRPVAATGAISYLVSWSSGSQTTTGTSLTVSQLLPGHTYTFTVRAQNDAGAGPAATAGAVPGSKDTKTAKMGDSGHDAYTSWTEQSASAWWAAGGSTYTAYCHYTGGQDLRIDGSESSDWVYLADGNGFGWVNRLFLNNPDLADSLLNCRSPLVPVP